MSDMAPAIGYTGIALLSGVLRLLTFVAVVVVNGIEGADVNDEDEGRLCRGCTGGVVPSVNGQFISLRIARAV